MDAKRFDTLTQFLVVAASSRRRVLGGLLTSVSAGMPLTLAGTAADARKKRRRKRKRKPNHAVHCPAGRVACDGKCRLPQLAVCGSSSECCSNRCIVQRCLPCAGIGCFDGDACCPGVTCEAGLCGGCQGEGGACQTDQDCCRSACNAGTCLSAVGEPCATGFDCFDCYAFPESVCHGDDDCCVGLCVAGHCRCPFDCCDDSDCPPTEVCRDGECHEGQIGG